MFARVTQLEVDVVRTSVEDAAASFAAEVVPELHRRPGFRGVIVLATPEGLGAVVTLWEREADAAPDAAYEATLARYMTIFRAPPGREVYEVLHADLPAAAPTSP